MAEQLKINYASAYLKSQILKSPWFIHKQSIRGQLQLAYDFINGNLLIDDSEEPRITQPYTVKLKHNNSFENSKNIAVIPINGSLMKYDYCGAPGMQSIANRIKQAEQTDNIAGILLHIDSPGGTVDGTQELGSVVKNCSKPILSFADGLAASAAYWVGSSANKFIAKDTTTEVGSIGVVLSFMDNQKALEEKGYVFHDVFADQSDEKWKEMLDAQKGDYSTLKEWTLNPIADEFQNTVKENRANVKDKALRGRVFLAKQAKKLGLIDGIGDFNFALKELNKLIVNNNKKIMEKEEGKVIEVNISEDEKSLFDKFLSYVKPEIKDISKETKAEYETKISDLKAENAELKNNIEAYGIEKEKTEADIDSAKANESKAVDDLELIKTKHEGLKTENSELKTQLTKSVAVSTQVINADDKLEMGKLSAEDEAWINTAKKMSEQM